MQHHYYHYYWLIIVVVVAWTIRLNTATPAVVPNDSELEATAYSSISQPNGTYVFGYDNVRDSKGNEHFRYEEKLDNGTIVGEYGFTDNLHSTIVRVSYVADERGFRPKVEIQRL